MPIGITDKLYTTSASASLEAFYGPYASTAAALAAIPSNFRAVGKKIAVVDGSDNVTEYVFNGGVADINLVTVESLMSGGGGGGTSAPIYTDPAGLPVNSNTTSYLNSNFGSDPIATEVYDTANKFMYKKIATSTWTKTAAVSPDDDMDPSGVIQGVNLISYK